MERESIVKANAVNYHSISTDESSPPTDVSTTRSKAIKSMVLWSVSLFASMMGITIGFLLFVTVPEETKTADGTAITMSFRTCTSNYGGDQCAVDQGYTCADYTDTFGILFTILFIPISAICFRQVLHHIASTHPTMVLDDDAQLRKQQKMKLLLMLGFSLLLVLLTSLVFGLLVAPNFLRRRTLLTFLGSFIFLLGLAFTLTTATATALSFWRWKQQSRRSLQSQDADPVGLAPRRPAGAIGLFAVLCAFLLIPTSILPNVWVYSGYEYMVSLSKHSIFYGSKYSNLTLLPCISQLDGTATKPATCLPAVWNMYLDQLLWLMGLPVAALICNLLLRYVPDPLHRPVRVIEQRMRKMFAFTTGMTIGETIFIGAIITILLSWFVFWFTFEHLVKESTGAQSDLNSIPSCCKIVHLPINKTTQTCTFPPETAVKGQIQRLARTAGHMTTMGASMLLFPVTKKSVWFHAVGIPFERALSYHRGLGWMTYIFMTLHMLLWWVKWWSEGNWIHNLYSLTLRVSEWNWHYDNFTVPFTHLMWVALTISIALTFLRRKSYELFYYFHLPVGLLFYVVGVLHAWNFWYMTCVGMIVYAIDAAMRVVGLTADQFNTPRGQAPLSVALHHDAGVIEIHFPVEAFRHTSAGQYAFITAPCVSGLQRHPFTISSAPSDTTRTFHIKIMESDSPCLAKMTFTQQLEAKIMDTPNPRSALRDVSVEGPYGNIGAEIGSHVVLVAGGIGITPVHSIFRELFLQSQSSSALSTTSSSSSSSGDNRTVHLIWTAKTYAELDLFSHTLYDALQTDVDGLSTGSTKFQVSLFVTRESGSTTVNENREGITMAQRWVREVAHRGRPDMESFINTDVTSVLACGPSQLISDASELALQCNAVFHSETFYF